MGLFFSPPNWAKTPAKAQAQLIAQQASLAPGSRSHLGLQLNMEPGWHTYWQNPGDSGLPTKIQWHNVPDEDEESSPRFSRDGRYFFFSRAENLGNYEYGQWNIFFMETEYLNLESLF